MREDITPRKGGNISREGEEPAGEPQRGLTLPKKGDKKHEPKKTSFWAPTGRGKQLFPKGRKNLKNPPSPNRREAPNKFYRGDPEVITPPKKVRKKSPATKHSKKIPT